MHQVAVLALHDFVPFDLGIACELFGRVSVPSGKQAYEVRVCAHARTIRSRPFEMRVAYGLDAAGRAPTPSSSPASRIRRRWYQSRFWQRYDKAWERGARLASICSGAFVLASDRGCWMASEPRLIGSAPRSWRSCIRRSLSSRTSCLSMLAESLLLLAHRRASICAFTSYAAIMGKRSLRAQPAQLSHHSAGMAVRHSSSGMNPSINRQPRATAGVDGHEPA